MINSTLPFGLEHMLEGEEGNKQGGEKEIYRKADSYSLGQ